MDERYRGIAEDVYGEIVASMRRDGGRFSDLAGQVFARRGKSIRPFVIHMATEAAGGRWEDVRDVAVAIESIHIASLVHDDIIDNSPLRRGAMTLNALYANATSVLFGDYLFIRALSRAAAFLPHDAYLILLDAVERMIRGETADSLYEGKPLEEVYLAIVADKTAALFAAGAELAARVSGLGPDRFGAARRFGNGIGMAFQIIDDVLDYDGVPDCLGKPLYRDIETGKVTLPLLYAAREGGEDLLTDLTAIADEGDRSDTARLAVAENGGIEGARETARRYLAEARAAYLEFALIPDTGSLDRFFDGLHDRRS